VNVGILAESLDISEVVKDGFPYKETHENKERNLKDFCCKHDGVVLKLPLTTAVEWESLLSFPDIPMSSEIATPWRPA
jgi:hypothetical protein